MLLRRPDPIRPRAAPVFHRTQRKGVQRHSDRAVGICEGAVAVAERTGLGGDLVAYKRGELELFHLGRATEEEQTRPQRRPLAVAGGDCYPCRAAQEALDGAPVHF